MRLGRLGALVLACAPLVAFAEDALDVVRTAEGYRLTRPAAEWQVRELPAPGGTHHALRLERAPAPHEISFSVYVGDATPGMTADLLCAANEGRWKARAAGPVTRATVPVAGVAAPSLTCDADGGGTRVRLRQIYIVRDGGVVLIQCQAPAAVFGEHEPAFSAALASFAFLPADPARGDARRIRSLAALCGNAVPRARTWAEAASRAARDNRLVLVVFEVYGGLPIQPLADSTTFMDDDVIDLCDKRFVVLPWSDQIRAPFVAPGVYGIGPHTFGQGVLFVTPEGGVVGSLGLLDPSLVDEAARAALAAHPAATGPGPPDPADARAAYRRGELDRAERLLAKPATGQDWLLRAALMRRLHRADEALQALDAAVAAGADRRIVAAEAGIVLVRAGRFPEAVAKFREAGDVPAARYWLAVSRAIREGVEPVRAELTALTTADPPNRWAMRAAAMLTGRGIATGAESVVWPAAGVRAAAEPRAPAPLAAVDVDRAEAEALSHLLKTQDADGTWPVPMAFAPDATASPKVAVTAIAGTALLPWRGRPGVDAAIARAAEAVLRARTRLVGTRPGLFDYTVWAQIFSVRFLAAVADGASALDAARMRNTATDIVAALAATRQPSGGWSYVCLEGMGAPADNSISFVTAAAWLALRDARACGVKVPDDLLDGAADLVARIRRADGSWAYQTASPGVHAPSEAALRGPLCALTLHRAGRTQGLGDIENAIAALAAQHDTCFLQAGKSLCHTAPDATAAYYLLYGYRFAAEALRELPEQKSAAARRAVLEQVLRFRRADGSFCDFPPIGPAYGTAMALEAMRLLR